MHMHSTLIVSRNHMRSMSWACDKRFLSIFPHGEQSTVMLFCFFFPFFVQKKTYFLSSEIMAVCCERQFEIQMV